MINISTSSACIFQKQITRNVILKSYQLSRENVNHLTIDTIQITLGIKLICIISLPQNFFDSDTIKLVQRNCQKAQLSRLKVKKYIFETLLITGFH